MHEGTTVPQAASNDGRRFCACGLLISTAEHPTQRQRCGPCAIARDKAGARERYLRRRKAVAA